jgi:hypothetical protein
MAGKNPKSLSARDKLILAGCLEPVEIFAEPLPVRIDQLDGLGENRLFRITDHVTSCCVSLCCLTDETSVPIDGVRLELQLPDFEFRWLDESEGDEYSYRCGPDYEFPRRQVINNRFPGVLYRGKGWTGWLVGVSCQALPCSLTGIVTGKIVLSDAFGRIASEEVSLMIEPFTPTKSAPKRRAGLFELDEMELEKSRVKGPSV